MKVARRGGNDFYSLIGIRKNKSLFVGIKEVLKHNSVKKIISVTTVKVSHTEEKKKHLLQTVTRRNIMIKTNYNII